MSELIDKHRDDQADRFDAESEQYESTHGSFAAQKYRDTFYRQRLFDFPLKGMKALDAMCASGIDTQFLIDQGADVTGLDISSECGKIFEDKYGQPCAVASVDESGFDDNTFDLVYISGGLHHVVPMLESTITEMHRILKPGGFFCFLEPNADTWANKAREIWYKKDERFTDEERALSYRKELLPLGTAAGFEEVDYFAGGNVAYLLLQQSNVVGSNKLVTETLRAPIMGVERVMSVLPLAPKLYFCARWKKI